MKTALTYKNTFISLSNITIGPRSVVSRKVIVLLPLHEEYYKLSLDYFIYYESADIYYSDCGCH